MHWLVDLLGILSLSLIVAIIAKALAPATRLDPRDDEERVHIPRRAGWSDAGRPHGDAHRLSRKLRDARVNVWLALDFLLDKISARTATDADRNELRYLRWLILQIDFYVKLLSVGKPPLERLREIERLIATLS